MTAAQQCAGCPRPRPAAVKCGRSSASASHRGFLSLAAYCLFSRVLLCPCAVGRPLTMFSPRAFMRPPAAASRLAAMNLPGAKSDAAAVSTRGAERRPPPLGRQWPLSRPLAPGLAAVGINTSVLRRGIGAIIQRAWPGRGTRRRNNKADP